MDGSFRQMDRVRLLIDRLAGVERTDGWERKMRPIGSYRSHRRLRTIRQTRSLERRVQKKGEYCAAGESPACQLGCAARIEELTYHV